MAAATLGSRLAGKVLGQYLSGVGGKGIAAAQKVGAGAAAVAGRKVPRLAAGSLGGRILEETVATGAVMGGAALLGGAADLLYKPRSGQATGSAYSLPIQQQYEAASALEQQKFEHQMAIIQARQNAAVDQANYGMTTNMVDPMSIANQLFKSQEY